MLGDCRASHFGYVSVSVEDEVKSPKSRSRSQGISKTITGRTRKMVNKTKWGKSLHTFMYIYMYIYTALLHCNPVTHTNTHTLTHTHAGMHTKNSPTPIVCAFS